MRKVFTLLFFSLLLALFLKTEQATSAAPPPLKVESRSKPAKSKAAFGWVSLRETAPIKCASRESAGLQTLSHSKFGFPV